MITVAAVAAVRFHVHYLFGNETRPQSEKVKNSSDRPSATRWVKASGDLLALRDRDFGGDFSWALLWQRAPFEVDVL